MRKLRRSAAAWSSLMGSAIILALSPAGAKGLDASCGEFMSCISGAPNHSTPVPPLSMIADISQGTPGLDACLNSAFDKRPEEWRKACQAYVDAGLGDARQRAIGLTHLGYANAWSGLDLAAGQQASHDIWEEAIVTDPNYALPYLAIGRTLSIGSEPHRALSAFDRLLSVDPENWQAHVGRATTFLRLSDHFNARVAAREAVRLAPDQALAHQTLGLALNRFDSQEEAIRELEMAARLYDEKTWRTHDLLQQTHPLEHLAKLHARQGDFEKALAAFDKLNAGNRSLPWFVRAERAEYLEGAGRDTEALDELSRAIAGMDQLSREKYEVKRVLLLIKMGDGDAARRAIKQLTENGDPHPVLVIQVFLKNKGYLSVSINGTYDSATETALAECLSQDECVKQLGERI